MLLLSVVFFDQPFVTSPQFWPFASDGAPQTFRYFYVVNLVDCGALSKVLMVNNTLKLPLKKLSASP